MHALKWWSLHTRMFFEGEPGGAASAPAPSSGGGDGTSSVAPPSPAGGDGGSSATPSPAPDPSPSPTPATPTPAPAEPGAPEPNPWESLGSSDDLDYLAVVPPAPPKPAAVPGAADPAKPVVPPAPAATPAPAQATPPAPAQPQPAGEAPPVALSPSDPVGIANALEANRDTVIAHLASTKFALSQEDITELETDVVAAVPKIMGRVFIENQMAMQKFLAQALPGMMKQYTTVSKANTDAEDQFFTAHTDLKKSDPQHRATAVRIASVYRRANPSIPLDQLIREVGPMVRAALQMNAPAPGPAAAPAAPGQPRGGTPFRPAVNGGGGSSPAPADENPWSGLGQQYDEG